MTPVEKYVVSGVTVYVKRDDLFAPPPFPPLAKARGLKDHLIQKSDSGVRKFGVFESAVSEVGLLTATACRQLKLECFVYFVRTNKREYTRSARDAEKVGATLVPLRQNVTNVCYSIAKRHVTGLGGYMVPFGFATDQHFSSIIDELGRTPRKYFVGGSVVVASGSGFTASALFRGLGGVSKLHAVSIGASEVSIRRTILKRNPEPNLHALHVVAPKYRYQNAADCIAPFPTDRYYDLKAWQYLIENIQTLDPPILFWNIGG